VATKFLLSQEPQLLAYSPSGSVKWTRGLGPANVHAGSPFTVGGTYTPAVSSNGTVYAAFFGEGLSAVRSSDGKLLWKVRTPAESGPVAGPDGTVYVTTDDGVVAVAASGEVKWTFGGAKGARALAIALDGTVYAADGYQLFALNAAGTQKWRLVVPGEGAPVVARDGTVYLGGGYLLAVAPDGKKKWLTSSGFAPDGDRPGTGQPVLGVDGTIYVAGKSGLYAFNPDGSRKWKFSMTQPSLELTPVISRDGTIYLYDDQDKLYAIGESAK
jgi:outer membrane protein assembly factor BamB